MARHAAIPGELSGLERCERLYLLRERRPGLWTGVVERGYSEVCAWASTFLPGQWLPKEGGLTWANGSRRAYLVAPERLRAVIEAHAVAEGLGLDPGWSIGSCARAILRWVAEPQFPYRGAWGLFADAGTQYHLAAPGTYPDADYYDVSSYYYTLMRGLPSLRVVALPGLPLVWGGLTRAERGRWERALLAVRDHKLLRNALWGCSLGSLGGQPFYHQGVRKRTGPAPGLFVGAGCLVARTAWEMTREAAEEVCAPLSNVDSVIALGGRYPSIWDRHGFRVVREAEGDAEVYSVYNYRVGGRATDWYRWGSRFRDPSEALPAPARLFYREWLRRAA